MSRMLLIFLCWQLNDPVRTGEAIRLKQKAQEAATVAAQKDRERRTRLEFEQRFDTLVVAIHDFAIEYNKAKGQVWPQKHADNLQKAMKNFESTPGWKSYVAKKR